MRIDIFPLNFFLSTFSPKKMFENRNILNWRKSLIVILFLNALLTIPGSVYFANLDSFSFDLFYPKSFESISEDVSQFLNQATYRNGLMVVEDPFLYETESKSSIVAGGVSDKKIDKLTDYENIVIFSESYFSFQENELPVLSNPYTADFSLENKNSGEIKAELNFQIFQQNKPLLVFLFSLALTVAFLLMNIIIIFGAAFLIFLSKINSLFSIRSYKESINLVLNCLTIPTLISSMIGLIHFDVTILLTIQMSGLALLIALNFYQTQFD